MKVGYGDDMATDDQGVFLADEVSEIDQGGSWSGHCGQDEQLGPVVFDVILHLSQLLDADQRVAVNLRLRRRPPVDLCAIRQSTTCSQDHTVRCYRVSCRRRTGRRRGRWRRWWAPPASWSGTWPPRTGPTWTGSATCCSTVALHLDFVWLVWMWRQRITLKVGLQPTGFTRQMWNVQKFISAKVARKKSEINKAIVSSWAVIITNTVFN